jgi:aerobic-type carbon monoxide dehydrogenase small subunit (CoxS/CutS family)
VKEHVRIAPPKMVAGRELDLGHGRTLECRVLEDGEGRRDCWLRLRGAEGQIIATIRLATRSLRAVAEMLTQLAGELGVEP